MEKAKEKTMAKKFILNADDFGMSEAFNKAVLNGYNFGLLKSASLCANGNAFEEAVNDIIPKCEHLSVGIHLNIIEGKSLTDVPMLTDKNGEFNKGYIAILLMSLNKNFINQVEQEFRTQIEKIKSRTKVDHIDSHVHTHAIPEIFKLVVKLAKEYDIPYIRTQYEKPYFVPDIKKHLNTKYPPNILKIILLNTFTAINKKQLKNSNIKTNDFLIGVGYTGMMNDMSIEYGLKALKNDFWAEALIHPCDYDKITDSHYTEYLITQNEKLINNIKGMGIEITNHSFE